MPGLDVYKQGDFGSLLDQFSKQAEQARAANLARYAQAMAIYDELVERYRPGGAFETRALQQLGREKIQTIGRQRQQMISQGLYGTTAPGALEKRWETEVGEPARLNLEDVMMQRLSQAQLGKAGFIERREDVYPDYSLMAQLAQMAGRGQYQGGGGGGFRYGGTETFEEQMRRSFGPSRPMLDYYTEMAEKRKARGFTGNGGKYAGEPGYEGIPDEILDKLQNPNIHLPGEATLGREKAIEIYLKHWNIKKSDWQEWTVPKEYLPPQYKIPQAPKYGPYKGYGYTGQW